MTVKVICQLSFGWFCLQISQNVIDKSRVPVTTFTNVTWRPMTQLGETWFCFNKIIWILRLLPSYWWRKLNSAGWSVDLHWLWWEMLFNSTKKCIFTAIVRMAFNFVRHFQGIREYILLHHALASIIMFSVLLQSLCS